MTDNEKLIEATGILRQWREHMDADVEDAIETVLAALYSKNLPVRSSSELEHQPRDWFTPSVYPSCSCGYHPGNNTELIAHWNDNGIRWVEDHGTFVIEDAGDVA